MNICEHLTATAQLFPDKEAIVFQGQRFSYRQLDLFSRQAAAMLLEAGIQPGDRVTIMLPNVPAFAMWYYAALRVGAIAVSISTRLTPQEVAFVVGDCGAKVFIRGQESASGEDEFLPDCVVRRFDVTETGEDLDDASPGQLADNSARCYQADPQDAAVILYTSGTTGFAKGATLSHMNVRSNVNAFNHLCQMQSDDRVLLSVPLFHCFGQNAILNSIFNVGGTIVLQRQFDLHEAKQLIAQEQVTQLYGVPTMFQLFHDSCEPADLRTVRYCFSAAATLPVQVSQRWQEKFGMPVHEGYGLTETSPFASYNHRLKYVMGSIGTPIDAVEMKIVDTESGQDCPPGELGEIVIRGPNVMLGYWKRPDDTARAIRQGWFYSGDIGRIDEQGFFHIVDRVKDMIAVGGLKVYPAEVERVLLDHAAISDVAVVGFPDAVFGEQVVAFVVSSGQAADDWEQLAAGIKQHARTVLANYKVPQRVVFLDELPRNPSGKILKTRLREYDLLGSAANEAPAAGVEATSNASGTAAPAAVAKREPTLRKMLQETHAANRHRVAVAFIQEFVQSLTLADEPPAAEARFLDAGLDSLMLVEMSSQIQAEVGPQHEISATLVFDYPRICELADFLVETMMPIDSPRTKSGSRSASVAAVPSPSSSSMKTREQVAALSEQEALEELMRELESG